MGMAQKLSWIYLHVLQKNSIVMMEVALNLRIGVMAAYSVVMDQVFYAKS